jgi:hypothetical protein
MIDFSGPLQRAGTALVQGQAGDDRGERSMSKRKPPVPAPVEEAAAMPEEPAILARLDGGPGWGLAVAVGLAVVAGVLAFRGFRRRA